MDFTPMQVANLAIYGEAITFAPKASPQQSTKLDGDPLLGIFLERREEYDMQLNAMVTVDKPKVDVRLADLIAGDVVKDDQIIARGMTFTIIQVLKDGNGMATCHLKLA